MVTNFRNAAVYSTLACNNLAYLEMNNFPVPVLADPLSDTLEGEAREGKSLGTPVSIGDSRGGENNLNGGVPCKHGTSTKGDLNNVIVWSNNDAESLTQPPFNHFNTFRNSARGELWMRSCVFRHSTPKRILYLKKWREENAERIKQSQRDYRRLNKDKINKAQRLYYKKNRNLRIRYALTIRMRRAIKYRSRIKTSEFLGCTIENFIMYLESKFDTGMSWDNYGAVWEIDHIMPCAIFDLHNLDHQKRCFHFSNLQPLFVSDNRRKGCKI